MSFGQITERNQDATVYVGSLDEKVTESLIWELFVQVGPVVNVHLPKDRITQLHQGYGFVEFLNEKDADYAIKIMNMIKLYNKPIKVSKACLNQRNVNIGANLFIGNLDNEVDEKLLYDTFSAFGLIIQVPKIIRDPDTGNSKGYGFINFANFEASDAAMEVMNGQYLCNRTISVSYAFKKDSKGTKHGSAAERLLAAQNPILYADRPNQLFADIPVPYFITVPPPPPPLPPSTLPPPPLPPTLLPPPAVFTEPPPSAVPFGTMRPPSVSSTVGFLTQSENLPTIPVFSTTQRNQQHPPIFPWQTELQNNSAQLSAFWQSPMRLPSTFNEEFFQQ